jgi:hypothetical protein
MIGLPVLTVTPQLVAIASDDSLARIVMAEPFQRQLRSRYVTVLLAIVIANLFFLFASFRAIAPALTLCVVIVVCVFWT